jgi:hypothetical protein
MRMSDDQSWRRGHNDVWSRIAPGQAGRPALTLRVFADPNDEDEPWSWEVVEVDDLGVEMEVDEGGAVSREEAMGAAEAMAAAWAAGTD